MALPAAEEIIAFWREAGPPRWFAKDDAFDAEIARRFAEAHHAAARGELADWQASAEGALALLLLLDQFPRNLWRGSAHAFASDPLARSVAHAALDAGHDQASDPALRVFFYLPFEHAEDLADQDLCLAKCQALDAESGSTWSNWAVLHRDIILRFGRFPHRNACLGRESSAEELAFLAEGGFSG
ncbi:MAG: DUF924 family protein [Novosphingobium sp.]